MPEIGYYGLVGWIEMCLNKMHRRTSSVASSKSSNFQKYTFKSLNLLIVSREIKITGA